MYRTCLFCSGDLGTNELVESFPESRLALEMALHESTERAALEGELHALEAAWREAEEIAVIADDLLVPPAVADSMRRLRVD